MVRVIVAMTSAAGVAALGQIILRRGMREVGSLETYVPLSRLSYLGQALSNPYVIAGTILNAIFDGLFWPHCPGRMRRWRCP